MNCFTRLCHLCLDSLYMHSLVSFGRTLGIVFWCCFNKLNNFALLLLLSFLRPFNSCYMSESFNVGLINANEIDRVPLLLISV